MEDRPERFIWFDYKKEEIFRRLCFIQKIRFTFAPCSNISLLAALLLFVLAKTPDVVMLLKTETPVGAILAGVFELNQLLVISYWLSGQVRVYLLVFLAAQIVRLFMGDNKPLPVLITNN